MRRRKRFIVRATCVALLVLVAPSSALAQACADADASGSVTVTDGVRALRAAAALPPECPLALCDVDGGGTVTVTDGVTILRAAAGLAVTLACNGLPPPADPRSGGAVTVFDATTAAFSQPAPNLSDEARR